MSKTLDPNDILSGNKYSKTISEIFAMLTEHGFVIDDTGNKRYKVTHPLYPDLITFMARSGESQVDAGAATDAARLCLEVIRKRESQIAKPEAATLPEWLEREGGFEYEPRGTKENPSFVMWDKECPELVFEYNLKGMFDKKSPVLEYTITSFKEILADHKSKLAYIMENYGVNNDRVEDNLRLFNSSLGYQSEAGYCSDFTLFLGQEIAELEARWQLQEDELKALFDKTGVARTESENGFTIIHKLHNNGNPINIKAFGSMGLIAPEQMEAIRNTVVKIEQAVAKNSKLTVADLRALAEDLITKHRPAKPVAAKPEPKPEPKKPEPLEAAIAEAPFKPIVEKPPIPFHHDFAVPLALFEMKPAITLPKPAPAPEIEAIPVQASTTPFSESSIAKIAPSNSKLNTFENNGVGYFYRDDAYYIVLNEFTIPEELKKEGRERQVQEFLNEKIDKIKAKLDLYDTKYGAIAGFNQRNGDFSVEIAQSAFLEHYTVKGEVEDFVDSLENTLANLALGQKGYVKSIIGDQPISVNYSSGKATFTHAGKPESTLTLNTYGTENILEGFYFKKLQLFVNEIRESKNLPKLKLPVHDFTNDVEKVYNIFPTALIKEELITPELSKSEYFMVESDHQFTERLLDLRQRFKTQQQVVKATAPNIIPATIAAPQAVEPTKIEPTPMPSQEMHLPKARPVNLDTESLAKYLKETVHTRGRRPEWLQNYVEGLRTLAETKQTEFVDGRRSLPNPLIDEYAKSIFEKPARSHKVVTKPARSEKAMPISPSLLASAAPTPAFSPVAASVKTDIVVEPPKAWVETVPTPAPVFVGAVTIAPTTTTIASDPAIAKKLGDLVKDARADADLKRSEVAEKLAATLQTETKGINPLTITDYFSWEKGGEYKTKRAFPSRKELALFLDVIMTEGKKRDPIPKEHEATLREGITKELGVILDLLSDGEIPQDNSPEVAKFRKYLLDYRAILAGVSETQLVTEFNKRIPAKIDTSEINADFIKAIEEGTSTKLDDKILAALGKALNFSPTQTQEAQILFSQIAKTVAIQAAPEPVAPAPVSEPQPVIAPTNNIVPIAEAIKSQAAEEIESAMMNVFAQITQSRKNIMQIFFSYDDSGSLRSFTEIAAKSEMSVEKIEAILAPTKPAPRIILTEEDFNKILNGFKKLEPQGSTIRLRNSLKTLNDLFKDYNQRARSLENANGRAIA